MKDNKPQNDIVIYQTNDGEPRIEVRIEGETAWLTQLQLVELFQSSKANIGQREVPLTSYSPTQIPR